MNRDRTSGNPAIQPSWNGDRLGDEPPLDETDAFDLRRGRTDGHDLRAAPVISGARQRAGYHVCGAMQIQL